jgi:hypothetical protein
MKRAAVYSSSGRRQTRKDEPPAAPRLTWGEWRKRHARAIRWTLGIAALLLFRTPAAASAVVRGVGAIFLLAAAATWLLAMLETMRLAEGDTRAIVPPKALTWISLALSVILVLGLLGSALAGRAS